MERLRVGTSTRNKLVDSRSAPFRSAPFRFTSPLAHFVGDFSANVAVLEDRELSDREYREDVVVFATPETSASKVEGRRGQRMAENDNGSAR